MAYRPWRAGLGIVFALLALAIRADTIVLNVLHSFSAQADGANPQGPLVLGPDGAVYGTTQAAAGEPDSYGTVYRLGLDGSLTTLHAFNGTDGSSPTALLLGPDGNLYGVTTYGGPGTSPSSTANSYGTIFRLGFDGSFASLYAFNSGTLGQYPKALILGKDGALYGTAWPSDSAAQKGVIFKMTLDGTVTPLFTFITDAQGGFTALGGYPDTLVQTADGSLAGTMSYGSYGSQSGAVFKLASPQGAQVFYTYNFDDPDGSALPNALVAAGDGSVYGTTFGQGVDVGAVFRMAPDGGLSYLWRFSSTDGSHPENGSLTLGRDGKLYGSTRDDGANHWGTLYSLDTSGGAFTILHAFNRADGSDAASPLLQLDNGTFIGTAIAGGTNGLGTAYTLSISSAPPISPRIALSPAGASPYAQTQQCVTASVQDVATGAPVQNVPVAFVISGTNPGSNTQNSGSAGTARFCWTSSVSGTDTLTVSSGNATATAVINWIKRPVTLQTRGFINLSLGAPGSSELLRFTAQLSDGLNGAPVAGRTVSFTSEGKSACQAQTDASGNAICSTWAATFYALLTGSYQASFAGDPVYLPATASGTLLSVGK